MSMTELQLLSFSLAEDSYGIDITKVQEIRAMGQIRKIPNTPAHWIGIIDFRDHMVPVLDLRRLFDYSDSDINQQTIMVVVSITLNESDVLVGLVVDAVSDVLSVEHDTLKKPPSMNEHVETEFVQGMFRYEEQIVVVLSLESLVAKEDISIIRQQLATSKSAAS